MNSLSLSEVLSDIIELNNILSLIDKDDLNFVQNDFYRVNYAYLAFSEYVSLDQIYNRICLCIILLSETKISA